MVLNVGSMIIKAKFDAGNMYSGMSNIISKLKGAGLQGKSLNTEFGRMKKTLMALTAVTGLTAAGLLGMLTSAVMQSPFLAAALAKLKIEFMLFGNAIAKHVAPILEKVVSLIKWLREKFEALPSPIQSVIVQAIIFGGIIAGLLGTLGIFVLGLAAVKSALLVLIPAGLIATVTAFAAKIWAIIAASFALQVALGLVAGILGVMALDRFGFLQWISDVGEGFRNWDSILRDVLISLLGLPALVGGMAIDISRGDLGFSTTKEWGKEWAGSMGRVGGSAIYGKDVYGGGTSSSSGAMNWEEYKNKGSNIESQVNNMHVDANAVTGDFSDPVVQNRLLDMMQKVFAKEQQDVTY